MDDKTALVSCIEYYSYLKNVPGNSVFASFETSGIISMILESNQLFPMADLGFYIGMIDGITEIETDSVEKHYLCYGQRGARILDVVTLLAKEYNLDNISACKKYYLTKTAQLVAEDSTGFYQKDADELFIHIKNEK